MKTIFLSTAAAFGLSLAALAFPAYAQSRIDIETVLSLGPLPLATESIDDNAKAEELRRALIMQLEGAAWPVAGQPVGMFGQDLTWKTLDVDDVPPGSGPFVWLVHLEVQRFITGDLKVSGLKEAEIWIGGKVHDPDEGEGEGEGSLELVSGTHAVWIYHHGFADDQAPALSWHGDSDEAMLVSHTNPERRVSARLLTNAETATNLELSPDGRYLAIRFQSRNDTADLDLARLEIRDLTSGQIVRQWTDSLPGGLAWSPDSQRLAVHEGNSVWVHDMGGAPAR
ncbi:MAG TPA: hypothetical protein VKO38_06225, partial [Wenzhouxiangella sp.]|nr:hypothetical protein [Wenzhouxiangella sp.]